MLQFINYDLQEPVKNYPALEDGVERIGGGIHILNGPWIVDTGKSPPDVLKAVTDSLRNAAELNDEEDRGDKLLVFPVQKGEISTGRPLKHRPIEPHPGDKVLAVSYTFRNPRGTPPARPSARRREALIAALGVLGETCHPLDALWLVKTDRSAHEAHLALEKAVPLTTSDELVVAEVNTKAKLNGRPVKGAEEGLETKDHDWLVKAGVLARV